MPWPVACYAGHAFLLLFPGSPPRGLERVGPCATHGKSTRVLGDQREAATRAALLAEMVVHRLPFG